MKILLFILSAGVLAAAQADAPGLVIVKTPAEVDWKASGSLPPGTEYHLIHENKATHGVELLVRFAKGYALPFHSHSHDETILILKGKLLLAAQDKETLLRPGTYAVIPAGTPHALTVKGFGSCEFMTVLAGPFDMRLR